MQSLEQYRQIILTEEQSKEVQKFKDDLQNGSAGIAFEGSLLEGKAYLKGLAEIVETTYHA